MNVKPSPEGFHSVTPYLTVRGADKVIEFLRQAFNAEVSHAPIKRPDGKIMHAQVKISDSCVMLGEESDRARRQPPLFISMFRTSTGLSAGR